MVKSFGMCCTLLYYLLRFEMSTWREVNDKGQNMSRRFWFSYKLYLFNYIEYYNISVLLKSTAFLFGNKVLVQVFLHMYHFKNFEVLNF